LIGKQRPHNFGRRRIVRQQDRWRKAQSRGAKPSEQCVSGLPFEHVVFRATMDISAPAVSCAASPDLMARVGIIDRGAEQRRLECLGGGRPARAPALPPSSAPLARRLRPA
jgi:hypothetical protein